MPDFATIDGSYEVPRAYNRMAVNGLASGTANYFRVKVKDGRRVGQPSAAVAATTSAAGSIDVRVATYNVLDPTLGAKALAPWSERRKNLAKTIDSAGADIVALQEAGWSQVKGGITPAQDLKKLIDKKMVLSKAGYKGDQLLYSPAKYTALKHGSFRLPRIAGDGVRSAIWQEFRDKATGTKFIALSTHLTSGIGNNAGRVRQAKSILSKLKTINPAGLPIVMMGDLNSYDARADVTPMSLFADAGYVDSELSSPATDTPTLNTWVKATSTTGSIRFDHIAVSQSVSVTRTAIENPKLKGPASDHRLLWADIAIATS
jgi:endonuclease/exonuclease/phosphatase family metal-dependent hydrolase